MRCLPSSPLTGLFRARFAATLASVLGVLAAPPAARAQLTVVWGGGSGSWNTPGNWVSGAPPKPADGAQVTAGSASVDTDVTIARLLLSGGNVGGAANLTLTDSGSTWTGGALNSGGTLTVGRGGTLEISTGADHDFAGHVIVNQGAVTWTTGQLRSGQGGSITNASGATFTANADGYTIQAPGSIGGTALFTNLGTLAHTTSGTVAIDIPLINSGSISVSDGALLLRAGGTSSGLITTTGTGSLSITNGYTLTDGSTLNGVIHATGGTLTATGNITVNGLSFEGANLAGTQTFLGGTINWVNGAWNDAATTTLAAGTTLNISSGADHDLASRAIINRGTINWTAGYIRSGQGSVFTNAAGGTFNDFNAGGYTLQAPSGIGGTFSFNNEGTYRRNATGVTIFDIPLTNSGAIDLQQGGLTFRAGGSFTSTGTLTAAAGASVVFASDFTLTSGSALMGAGSYALTAGTLTVPSGTLSVSTFDQNGGVLAGSPTINGIYNWNAGNWNGGGTTTIASGSTLNIATGSDHDLATRNIVNNGVINWTAGHIRSGQGSVLTNAAGGTFNDYNAGGYTLQAPGSIGGFFSFANAGTYRRNASGVTIFDIPLTNSGTIDVQQGGLTFRAGGNFTSSGTITAALGTSVTFASDFTLTAGSSLSGKGTYSLVSGTLTVPSGALNVSTFNQEGGVLAGSPIITGIYTWNAGNWNGGGTTTIASGSTLNIATGSDHDLASRAVINNGTVNWTAGHIRSGQGSVFTNSVGAVFNDFNASSYTLQAPGGIGGTFAFENNGFYYRNATGTTFFDIPFTNRGSVDVAQGNLEFRAGGLLEGSGTFTAAAGTNVYFRTSYTIRNGSSLMGAGDYWLTGGTLEVTGNLTTSRFTQTGGVLEGVANGINGLYNWESGNWNAAAGGSTTTITAGSTLNIATGSDHDLAARLVTNLGTVNWTAGYIRGGQGAVFTNGVGGVFNDLNASSYSLQAPSGIGGAFTFVNNGTYRRNAPGTTYFDIPFNNNAAVDLQQGNLEFRAGGVMSPAGTIIAALGTNVFFRNDYTISNGASLGGAGTYTLTGGTLKLAGAVGVGNLTQTGGTLAGTHSISGTYSWDGGTWNGAAGDTTTIAAGGTLNLGGGADHDFNARAITNLGKVNWTSGYIRAGQGSVFTNGIGGTFNDLQTAGYTLHSPGSFGGSFTFTNQGTYLRNASGTTYFDIPLVNNGVFKVAAGDVRLRAGGTMQAASAVVTEPGGRLFFESEYTILDGATFSGTGLVNQISGRLVIDGALRASSFLWSGGNWNAAINSGLTSTVASGTTLNLTNANDDTRDFYGRTILNRGIVNWSSAYLRSGGGGSFTNDAGGVFNDLQTDGYTVHTPGSFGGAFSFTNNGTYNRNAPGITYFDVPLNNNGAFNVVQGDVQLRGGGTMSATSVVNVASGAHLYFTNNYALETGSQFTGPGLVNQIAGTLTANGTLTAQSFLWSGGNWNAATNSGLTTTLAASTILNLTAANDATRDFYGRTILNKGTANWYSGYLRSGGGGSFTNDTGGVFNDLQTDGYSIHTPGSFGGAFSFTNNGTYNRNAPGTTYFDAPLNNNGTLNVLQGEVKLRAGGTMSATSVVNVASGAALYFTDNYTLATGARFAGAGVVDQIGGTLTLDGTLTAQSFLWSGGNWNAATNSGLTTTIGVGTTLNLSAAHDSTRDFYGRTILNRSIVNWSSGYLRSGGGGSFVNASGGTFHDLNADGYSIHTPGSFGGTFTFTNEGTYWKTTGGTTTVDVPFTNSGRILIEAGTLAFNSSFTNSGSGALLSTGGNFSFSQPLVLGTGTLAGVGTITAPSVTAGGLVSPGNSPGQLSLTGDLTLLATSALLVELGGTSQGVTYDFLSVGGNAALAGTLVVNFTGGFQATVSGADTFTVLTAGNLSGAFTNVLNGQRVYTSDGLGSFVVNYGAASALSPKSVVLTNFVPVPEPSTYALMGIGVLVLAAVHRRRGSRHQR